MNSTASLRVAPRTPTLARLHPALDAPPSRPPRAVPERFLVRAWMLVLAWPVSHGFLLFLNWRHWGLVRGEATGPQSATWLALLLGLACSVAWGTAVAVRRRGGAQVVHGRGAAAAFLLTVLALALFAWKGWALIPGSMQGWMLRPEVLIFQHFSLLMPLALLAAVIGAEGGAGPRIVWFGGPILFVLGSIALGLFGSVIGLQFPFVTVLVVGGLTAFGVVCAAGALAGVRSAYARARASSVGALTGFSALVALVAPVAGLLLNAVIPFPYSFQRGDMYLVAVLNGLLLTLPFFAPPRLHRAVWLAQCALFPFTAYFFVVFLAFLPFFPLGLLALGGGVLMLVPSALFALHLGRIVDGFRLEVRDGRRFGVGVLAALALIAWPAVWFGGALADRGRIEHALDYAEFPDLRPGGEEVPDREGVGRLLNSLAEFKAGLWLPYLSDAYNAVVFDGLVLPSAKIEKLHRFFTGEPLPAPQFPRSAIPFGGGRRSASVGAMESVPFTPPPATARLVSVAATPSVREGVPVRQVRVEVGNSAAADAEYVGRIELPPGVVVTGFWLHIGGERVPGRLFEKRAALWVYQRITHSPEIRDPAILRHIEADVLELRIFPVPGQGSRLVELELAGPGAALDAVRFDGTAPRPATEAGAWAFWSGSGSLAIPAEVGPGPVVRRPFLQIVADVSTGSPFREAEVLERAVRETLRANPDCAGFRLMLASVVCEDTERAVRGRDETLAAIRGALGRAPGHRGGFDASFALRSVLWRRHAEAESASAGASPVGLLLRPRIVILSGQAEVPAGDLDAFASVYPDLQGFTVRDPSGGVREERFPWRADEGIRLARAGSRFALLSGPAGFGVFGRGPETVAESIEVWDAQRSRWVPIAPIAPLDPGSFYARALEAQQFERERRMEPWRARGSLGDAVGRSAESGALTASTAFVVMESQSQWESVARASAKASGAHESLAMGAAPEPGVVFLLGTGLLTLAVRRRRSGNP